MSEIYSKFLSLRRLQWLKFKLLPFLSAALILCYGNINTVEAKSSSVFQETTVSGQVVDEASAPIPGVNIVVKGTTNGTTTDASGNYRISLSGSNATLIFSFIGYVTQEVTVGNQTSINVSLAADVATLAEVVVVGYGTQTKSSVTGAVSSVTSKEISALPVPSVSAALQGRVPGVLVTNNGGPGSSAIVRIRGIGSITQNADPLYVVDGFPAPNFNLNSVDTKDIESVEILKDAAATAVYGSRAANGVVIITTKSGSKDQKVHVDIEAYTGTQSAWKKLDLLKRDQYLAYGTALATNAGGTPPSRFANMNQPIYAGTSQTFAQTETDWQDEMFRAAPISQVQGSVSGSTEKTKMYMSFGRFKQDGIMLGTSFDRYNGRLSVETKIGKRFTIGENLQVTQSNNQNQLESGGRTMVMHMLRSVPYIAVYNPNTPGGFNGTQSVDGSDPENPVRLALMDIRKNHNLYILSNTFLQVKITDALKYKFTFGVNSSQDHALQNDPIFSDGGYQGRTTHNLTDNRNSYYSLYYSNQLTYDKTFGGHDINAVVVAERQDEKNNFLNTSGRLTTNEINNLTGGTNLTVDNQTSEMFLLSFLGRVNYAFKEKYLLSVSLRRDGFSGFAPDHKWGNFPGASLGWKVNEENFMRGVSQISDLKVRASYGKVGARPTDAYSYLSSTLTNSFYPFNNVLAQGSYYQKLPNFKFGWEVSTMKNIGLDLGLFSNKITFSADYFIKDTDQLILGTLPATSLGLDEPTALNIAKMKNSGIEFTAGYSVVGKDFTFNASGNVSIIKNEIKALDGENAAYFAGGSQDYGAGNITRTVAGSSIQQFYLSETNGIFQNEGEIVNGEGKPTQAGLVLPLNPDGTVDLAKWQDPANSGKYTRPGDVRFTGNMKEMGSFLPKFTYGLNLSATFKGFDLTMFIQGVQGNKIYNGTRVITEGMQRLFNSGIEVTNAWTPSNTNTDVPRAVSGDPNSNARPSDRFLEDGSYLRIKNLNIGYTIPSSLLSFTNGTIKKFRIYFTAQNLLTVTKYKGYDPEVGNRNINNSADNNRFLVNGIDYGQFPQPRTFIGGVQLGF
ncbi:SusC/RagA family TonB-linked outer membrane protein [Chryseolinea lacunae]|uniref:TonB-dependent receptor n=1 Tax=Chryseolinea lacunae TaxID=2801331 RepID=A0ABS1KZF5_9BACT|nr:TonB-dependent receptor [Chryseolinea lacunae]MBL0744647.1 TonB-dependent receptor [Chryseolinea lacunae]